MKRVGFIIIGLLVVGGLIVGFVLLTRGNETPAAQPPPPPDDTGNAEPPADQNPPPEPPPDQPPPDPTPLLTLTSAELWWDIGEAECVAAGETLVPTLTVCVHNDGDGEADAALLAGVVSDVEGLGGTPYDEVFAGEPLAPGEERCLSATLGPSFLAQSSVPELASLADAEIIPLELPEMPPLCEPEPAPPVQQESSLPEGQFTEFIAVYDCHLVGGGVYEWYTATGIFTELADGSNAFVGVVEGSQEGPFSGPWQGGCPGGSSSGGGGDGGGGDGGGGGPPPQGGGGDSQG